MKGFRSLYLSLVFLLLYAPIVMMVFFSFNASSSTALFTGFSFRWYKELFANEEIGKALLNTLLLAISASLLATVLGTAAAVGISKMKKSWRSSVLLVTNVPMINPDIVTGVALLMLFVFVGSILHRSVLGFGTVLIAHVTFNLPYVILSIMPKLRQMDKNLPEAARDLGCTPLQSFFKVELPCILPGILSGALMAFTLSLDDFVITQFNKGTDFNTLPTYIYSMTKKKVTPDINALFSLIFLAILLLLIASNVYSARMEAKRGAQLSRPCSLNAKNHK